MTVFKNGDITPMEAMEATRSEYPRVSNIIGKQTEAEMRLIPIDALANAAIRGTKIHAHCTAYLKGLWIPEIEEEYEPYVKCFMNWADENVESLIHSNIRLYDDTFKFTGEFDCIVKLKDSKKIALIDIKTSASPSKSWPIQLAAYNHLCCKNDYNIDTSYIIHLKKTKSSKSDEEKLGLPFKIKSIETEYQATDLKAYWLIFSSALECYYYFERKEVQNVI